uniref:Deoxyuridine 5'-triphosphate nucleotidohydrolase n=1 Tax=Dunaliella tertiolecta TaxID=3047 RepID=A0A6S8H8H7_DUNTE|mmetsp:Transcript_21278/g.59009  ORF Transcript_21278/g.59009 Transcript_21278/m.59009 type:complete len:187 (+) Transcript_21278:503-1063(+)
MCQPLASSQCWRMNSVSGASWRTPPHFHRVSRSMHDGPPNKAQKTMDTLLVKKLSEFAVLPKRGSAGAAGYDLASAHECVVPARGRLVVPTDLSIKLPSGTYGRVAPRSGLAVKHFIDTGAGVVDEDYRGPLGVVLFNHSDADFKVNRGDRVAQLIIEKIATPEVQEVENLDDTARGSGGYGSTGQ